MKKIQLITYNEREYMNYNKDIQVSNFNNLKALDNYDINVIDLSSSNIWKNKSSEDKKPSEITILTNDFMSIKTMIINSKKTNIVICLPQNLRYYCKYYDENYYYQLKDIISIFIKVLEQLVPFLGLSVVYENNITQIGSNDVASSFYFNEKVFSNLTRAKDSEKVTTIRYENTILTTLDLIDKQKPSILVDFLGQVGLDKKGIDFPEWLYEYEFDDDTKQNNAIKKAMQEIEIQKCIIRKAKEKLEKNMHFKSVLVTQSDELVNVVFEILEYIFDISLKDFNDKRKEDFLLKKNGITFIGEIKGVTSNIRYENISQLDVHYSKYMDKLQDEGIEENIKKILIMNYERNKDINQRNNINKMQIDLAIKNNTLIIDTKSLLVIYEKILQGTLKKEDVIKYISNNSGIVELENI